MHSYAPGTVRGAGVQYCTARPSCKDRPGAARRRARHAARRGGGGGGGGGGDARRRRFLLPPPPLHSASGIGGSPARRPARNARVGQLGGRHCAPFRRGRGGVFSRLSPKAQRRPAALSPCPASFFARAQSARPARAFFDGRRLARADPRQAGRRRIVAEPDRGRFRRIAGVCRVWRRRCPAPRWTGRLAPRGEVPPSPVHGHQPSPDRGVRVE